MNYCKLGIIVKTKNFCKKMGIIVTIRKHGKDVALKIISEK